MSTQNEIMTLRGFDDPGNLCDIKREQPFSAPSQGKHYGMPISTCKFLHMLYRFWLQNTTGENNPFKDVWWVDFSKASLFRILAQEDCEYVRFYLAIPDENINDASLALEGLMSGGHPIKLDQTLVIAGTMKGVGDKDPESPKGLMMKLTDGTPPANNEEKGNGGSGNPQNIYSLKGFMEEKHEILKDTSFQEFIKEYYQQATDNFM